MIVLKRAVAKNCDWICSFWILLDLLGFFSLIQTSIPIVPWKICVKMLAETLLELPAAAAPGVDGEPPPFAATLADVRWHERPPDSRLPRWPAWLHIALPNGKVHWGVRRRVGHAVRKKNSILLLIFVFALGPFLWLEHTGTGKSFHLQKDCQHIVGKKIEKYSCCKSCMKKNGSTSEKEEWRRLEGKNPTKWHWEKGSWRWGLDKIEALQNGSWIFICFIKSWMHWFDHFLTKLPKYLWIKTGDRHYLFVEPRVINRPFCRMETVYQNRFVETGVGSLQNGPPQPPQAMGRRIGKSWN